MSRMGPILELSESAANSRVSDSRAVGEQVYIIEAVRIVGDSSFGNFTCQGHWGLFEANLRTFSISESLALVHSSNWGREVRIFMLCVTLVLEILRAGPNRSTQETIERNESTSITLDSCPRGRAPFGCRGQGRGRGCVRRACEPLREKDFSADDEHNPQPRRRRGCHAGCFPQVLCTPERLPRGFEILYLAGAHRRERSIDAAAQTPPQPVYTGRANAGR